MFGPNEPKGNMFFKSGVVVKGGGSVFCGGSVEFPIYLHGISSLRACLVCCYAEVFCLIPAFVSSFI